MQLVNRESIMIIQGFLSLDLMLSHYAKYHIGAWKSTTLEKLFQPVLDTPLPLHLILCLSSHLYLPS